MVNLSNLSETAVTRVVYADLTVKSNIERGEHAVDVRQGAVPDIEFLVRLARVFKAVLELFMCAEELHVLHVAVSHEGFVSGFCDSGVPGCRGFRCGRLQVLVWVSREGSPVRLCTQWSSVLALKGSKLKGLVLGGRKLLNEFL